MVLGQEIKAQTNDALEFNFVGHQVIGRGDDDIGVCATALDMIGGIGDARSRIAACRLAKHLVGTEHGQMLQDQVFVGFVGHYEEVLVGDDGAETFVGAADKALMPRKKRF